MRIASIECGRFLAIVAVMMIHSSPFANPFDPTLWSEPFYLYLGGAINQLCRFAVPFFFLCSGFFLQPKLEGAGRWGALWRYCRPLLLLWVSWSLLYLLIPFNPLAVADSGYLAAMAPQWQMLLADPLNQWWVGGMVHLWFLPALMLAALLLSLSYHLGALRWALWLGSVLYLLALAGGSYGKPIFDGEWALLTRNGPFFSLLFVALGALVRERGLHMASSVALGWMGVGLLIYLLEALLLYTQWQVPFIRHDFLLGSVPWALGLFWWLQANPEWGRGTWCERLAPAVPGLYCLHMLLVIWLFPIGVALMSPLWELAKLPLVLAGTLLLYTLLRRLPGSSWLLRGGSGRVG